MPRQARKKSESGIYHVMLRGINQQQIFEEPEDFEKFLQILKDCKAISGYKLFAYCLMGNHIHLLIKPEEESLEQAFKRIGGRFVYWYNVKYQRIGHLFQDRFRSEPVETDEYFMTVLRYIHQNPIKAGLCKVIDAYTYSSYKEYFIESDLIDTESAYQIISQEQFREFHEEIETKKCLDADENIRIRLTDEQAKCVMKRVSGKGSVSEYQTLREDLKEKYVKKLYEKKLSIRQISRLTGVSKGLVEKWIKG